MKNVLIITTHYPPSNLTGVHRGRLFAKYLPQFGWNPIVLTVHENYYEEKPDFELNKLIPEGQHIEKVNAFQISKPRLIGDLGLRAFFQLKKKAIEIIQTNKIDFVYILIPSFYLSLLGPLLHRSCGVKYGIDYIDPWVHLFPGSEKIFSRHWFSTKLSKLLEPFAIRGVSLITSVSSSYIEPIYERNRNLSKQAKSLSVPYGWDSDERLVIQKYKQQNNSIKNQGKLRLVYSGAFLPKSEEVLYQILFCIKENIHLFQDVEIHFIGTDVSKTYPRRLSITEMATSFDLSGVVIFEHPERISYFELLGHIDSFDGIFILGSTESHYTPSKIFNAFVLQKPIFAVLHSDSSAKEIIEDTQYGVVCSYSSTDIYIFQNSFITTFYTWKNLIMSKNWKFDLEKAELFSAKYLTGELASTLDEII